MIRKIKDFILYKNPKFYSAFPSIVLLSNNSLLLMFRRARDIRCLLSQEDEESQTLKQMVDHIDSRSHLTQILFDLDLQATSQPEILAIDPEAADQDASLLLLSNGDLLLSSFTWYPVHSRLYKSLAANNVTLHGHPDITGCYYIMWGGLTRLSRDNGQSWSEHNYLPQLPGANDIVPGLRQSHGGPASGQAIEIDNEILLPIYKKLPDDKTSSCHLYVSNDGGTSWSYRAKFAIDKTGKLQFYEPSLLHCGGDKVMAFIRSGGGDDHLITTMSNDRGRTWEDWEEREVVGHPTHALRLSDGRVFLCYGYRHEPFGIRGRLMDSSAHNFIGEEIIIRDDAFCADIGYPWAAQMPDGKILVVYYFTQSDGIRHIAGSLLAL